MVLVAYKNGLVEFHFGYGNIVSSMNMLFSTTNLSAKNYFETFNLKDGWNDLLLEEVSQMLLHSPLRSTARFWGRGKTITNT